MALLTFGDWVGLLSYGIDEGHMVREDVKVDGLEEVAKMAYGSMDSEELPVECPVILLCGGQLAVEESDGCRSMRGDLLKGCIASVCQELELCVLHRERQKDCLADGHLRVLEGLLKIRVPIQLAFFFPLRALWSGARM